MLAEPGRFEPIIVLETRGARTLLPILRRRLHARTGRAGAGVAHIVGVVDFRELVCALFCFGAQRQV